MNMKRFMVAIAGFVRRRPGYSLFVWGSLLVVGAYMYLVMSDRYVSHARIRIQAESNAAVPSVELGLMSLGGTTSSVLDAQLLLSFIESPAMLEKLDAELDLREYFSRKSADPLSRLSSTASREAFLNYYLSRVKAEIDDKPQLLMLDVQGFDPEFTQRFADAIMRYSEDFVNEMSWTLAREQIAFVQKEVDSSNLRLERASLAMIKLQSDNLLFNPSSEAQAVGGIIAGIQQDIAQQQTQLANLLSYMSPSASEVRAVRSRLKASEAQLELERRRQVGGASGSINEAQLRFREAQAELSLATDIYKGNLSSLEAVRTEASKKVKHLVRVSGPTLPDAAEEPQRSFLMITMLVVFHIVYMIGTLIIATIKDHQD